MIKLKSIQLTDKLTLEIASQYEFLKASKQNSDKAIFILKVLPKSVTPTNSVIEDAHVIKQPPCQTTTIAIAKPRLETTKHQLKWYCAVHDN